MPVFRLLAALTLICATATAVAQAPTAQPAPAAPNYQAGKHYFVLEPAQPTASRDRIEVIEVFSYGCVHCAQFQPLVDAWKKKAHPKVSFVYLPATFRPDFAVYARGYYAAEALGAVERSHQALFDQIFVKQKPLRTLEDLGDFYAGYGVSKDDFLAATKSFAVENKMKRVGAVLPRYGVDGTPTIVVNGKYRITGESAEGYDKVFNVVDFLVAKELAATP